MDLNFGTQDYITKPCSAKLLIARIEAAIKAAKSVAPEIRKFGDIQIDYSGRLVTLNGEKITLTMLEFELLKFLTNNVNIALSRDKIINNVWNYDYFGDTRTIDTHIKKLRKKLGNSGEQIKTIHGVGYKFEVI